MQAVRLSGAAPPVLGNGYICSQLVDQGGASRGAYMRSRSELKDATSAVLVLREAASSSIAESSSSTSSGLDPLQDIASRDNA